MASLSRVINDRLQCILCPHFCKLDAGKTGICGVRRSNGDEIELFTYGIISGYSLDPLEKKPLYHFYPGFKILSIGSYGCNMRCDFCQNYHISQNVPEHLSKIVKPEKIVIDALAIQGNIGVAFTYNEPIVGYEYMRDIAIIAKQNGLKTVMVSNGYVNNDPLASIIGFIDAFNIDLKAFNNTFYRKLTGADLEPVKRSLKQIALSGRHLEVTTLIIPGMNDDGKEMELEAEWIASELGKNTPLHLSRYFPMYKREDQSTTEASLKKLSEIASRKLNHVYLGNTNGDSGQDTKCPGCGTVVTERSGYAIKFKNLDKAGYCSVCGIRVYENFTPSPSSSTMS